MAEAGAGQEGAGRRATLGLWACIALVVGNAIGVGIFALPASLAPFGGLALVAWLLTSAGAIVLALVFARLVQLVPRATVVGTLVIAIVYVLSTIGVMGALPPATLAGWAVALEDAATAYGPLVPADRSIDS